MRTYLINQDGDELVFDNIKTTVHNENSVTFEYVSIAKDEIIEKKCIHIKKLAGVFFSSYDNKRWKRQSRQNFPKKLLSVSNVFDVFYGYKPSGLFDSNSSDLKTQMPGKIIDILISEGDSIIKGQTLLILEAMKMENEIKASNDGVVKKIHVNIGDTLESGIMLIEVD